MADVAPEWEELELPPPGVAPDDTTEGEWVAPPPAAPEGESSGSCSSLRTCRRLLSIFSGVGLHELSNTSTTST